MTIQSIGLVVNEGKPAAVAFAAELRGWLEKRSIAVAIAETPAPGLTRPELWEDAEPLVRSQLIITLGGDGTILGASHLAAPRGIPLLGVHMGRFGFIAETLASDLTAHLDNILAGKMDVEERMMVEGDVMRGDEVLYHAIGLNDIVIDKGARTRLLDVRTTFGGAFEVTYAADGLVVATPTGSTAYALSAGGPLIAPTVQALLVAPICPHTLAARPVVIPADETVSVTVDSGGGEVLFMADSRHVYPVADGDTVRVRRAAFSARIVRLTPSSFYRKMRGRLLWGERVNA